MLLSLFLASVVFLSLLGPKALFFNMFTVPAGQPLVFDNKVRGIMSLLNSISALSKNSAVLIAVFLACLLYDKFVMKNEYKSLKDLVSLNSWAIPCIIGIFMIPVSVIGRMKVWATDNALSFALYFFALAVALYLMKIFKESCSRMRAARASGTLLLLSAIIIPSNLVFTAIPDELRNITHIWTNQHEVSYKYMKEHPGEAYFPDNPLSSLLAEGKLYHSLYGLTDYNSAGVPVSKELLYCHIPDHMRIIALSFSIRDPGAEKCLFDFFPGFSRQKSVSGLRGFSIYSKRPLPNKDGPTR
jgi:hypothetical protein